MQHQLPMAEIHTLGETCRAGRIKSGRLRILVEIRKVIVGGGGGEEILVFAREFDAALRGFWPIGQDDQCPYLVELRLDAFKKPNEFVVDEKNRRPGMID